jgi:hypothetical protein
VSEAPVTTRTADAATPAHVPTCLDCGAELAGPYCHSCGQHDEDNIRPMRALLAEIGSDVFAVDSRLFRTIRPLLFHPGLLTNEYMAGRRSRYIPAFRLYIGASVIYFLVLLVSGTSKFFFFNAWGPDGMFTSFVRLLPKLMFLLLPVFALILGLLYRRRLLAEHLVFALHYHAFAFLILPIEALIEPTVRRAAAAGTMGAVEIVGAIVMGAAELWVLLYLFVALRRVYRSSWLGAVIKGLLLMFVYLAFLGLVGVLSIPYLRTMLVVPFLRDLLALVT